MSDRKSDGETHTHTQWETVGSSDSERTDGGNGGRHGVGRREAAKQKWKKKQTTSTTTIRKMKKKTEKPKTKTQESITSAVNFTFAVRVHI